MVWAHVKLDTSQSGEIVPYILGESINSCPDELNSTLNSDRGDEPDQVVPLDFNNSLFDSIVRSNSERYGTDLNQDSCTSENPTYTQKLDGIA